MFTVGQRLRLKAGVYDEYKRRHDELWPEMADVMSSLGINMAIYRWGDHLFVFATAPDEQSWSDLEKHPVTPRWDAYMDDMLESDETGKFFVEDLPCAFLFGDFSP